MASRFWVGGTGTWDSSTTTHWSATTGGAGGASAPTTGDTVTFDGSSGGGTVTADATISGLSLASITMGAFAGTLDFSVNNPNITITAALSTSGTALRTLKMGNGTWTFTRFTGSNWIDFTTSTNMSLDTGSGTILIQPSSALTNTGFLGLNALFTFNNITINIPAVAGASSFRGGVGFFTPGTITTLVVTNVYELQFVTSMVITNGFSINGGSSSQKILVKSNSASAVATLSLGGAVTANWAAVQNIAVTGVGSFTASNSFDLGGNSSVTITPPASGGGNFIGG